MGKKKKPQSEMRRWCSTGWRRPPPSHRTPPPAPSPPSSVFQMGGKWSAVETNLFQNKVLLLLFLKDPILIPQPLPYETFLRIYWFWNGKYHCYTVDIKRCNKIPAESYLAKHYFPIMVFGSQKYILTWQSKISKSNVYEQKCLPHHFHFQYQ